LDIAYHADKDKDRLRAIEDAMEYLGLDKGLFSDEEGSMTLMQKQILKWTNPRSFPSDEAEKSDESVDAEFKTLEDWAREEGE
jgi:hypothetical protein